MTPQNGQEPEYGRSLRRVFLTLLVLFLFALFLFWRVDNTRAEHLRMQVTDKIMPSAETVMSPMASLSRLASNIGGIARLHEQNEELRRELQRMKAWREAALQLDQENARLRELNNVRVSPELSVISGQIMADSGSPFRQSALINLGTRDQIMDGWPVMDGLGLVGRISGVGSRSARVLLITDSASHIPVFVKPSDRTAILTGDNTSRPALDFIENQDGVQPGDRVVTSGHGGVFPPGLLIGKVFQGPDGRLRINPSADFQRLEIVRVLRFQATPPIAESNALIGAEANQPETTQPETTQPETTQPETIQPDDAAAATGDP